MPKLINTWLLSCFAILLLLTLASPSLAAPYQQSLSDTPQVTVTVPDFSITPPILISPQNSATVANKRPTFSWQVSTSPFPVTGYDFYLNDTLAAENINHTTGYLDSFFFTATRSGQLIYLNPSFDLGETHHSWYVIAKNSQNNTAQSDKWEFIIDTIPPFITLDRLDNQLLGWTTLTPSSIPPLEKRNLIAFRDNPRLYGQTEAYTNIKIDLICPPQAITFCADITTTFITSTTSWSYQIPHLFTNTTYTVFIQVADSAANLQIFPTFTVTLSPQSTITTPDPVPDTPSPPPIPPPPPKGLVKPPQNVFSKVFDTHIPPTLTNIVKQLTPTAQQLAKIASPIATASLLAQLVPFLGNIWYYLIHLFISFMQYFGFWEKRQPLGLVYDAITKHPLVFATARLYTNDSKPKLLETDVTNNNGIFNFSVKPGTYLVHLTKPHYTFPSSLVVGSNDGAYTHLYHGEPIKVGGTNQSIDICVPLDPDKIPTNYRFKLMQYLRQIISLLSHIFLGVGIIAAIFAIIGGADIFINSALISVYFLIFLAQISINRHHQSWGKVVNTNNQPLSGISLHLIDTKFNHLVALRVTDQQGKFQFTAPAGTYQIQLASQGYQMVEKRQFYSGSTFTLTGNKPSTLSPQIMLTKTNL